MGGPPPQPFNKGRLALIFVGLSAVVIGAWLLLRTSGEPSETVNFTARGDAPPALVPVPPKPRAAEQPVTPLLASANTARGERLFRSRCAACHTVDRGGFNGVGPNLHGVMGDRIATRPGYEASDALRRAGDRWDWETADRYLRAPRDFAPGTRMAFAGLGDAQDRADVLLYLNEQGGRLPAPAGLR